VDKQPLIDLMLVAAVAQEPLLLVGPPGTAKSDLVIKFKDALGIAAGLHEYARQSDIVGSAFYAQTVNVIGAIKTSRRNAAFETTGLVLKLYRLHFGELPVATEVTGLLDAQAERRIDRLLNKLELPTRRPGLDVDKVWWIMQHDKKALAGR
jgi:hypothetical protein